IQSQGRIAEVQIIQSDEEYFKFLNDKLSEEVDEFLKAETFDNRIEELADVLEVIDSICIFSKIDKNVLNDVKMKKFKERGGFNKRVLLIKK
ncbi:MAG TPA: nucleoside triphosphate pyrophosphohydrolase, partial [Rickettsiales bacterium]|nr:nucleoside triphosphate pyrophosphohydrolase [Rickettsiales bacterium]